MTKLYYAFNGDTDGICAAHQLFLSQPSTVEPITGVKRDIFLLKQIDWVEEVDIKIFDVVVEKNVIQAEKLLARGCSIEWFDHHISDRIPSHPKFIAHIDTSPLVNTSYIVARYLNNYSAWTIVGLCGDNIFETAENLNSELGHSKDQYEKLREMGELINYNAYGETVDDLHFHPAAVLESFRDFVDPFDYLEETDTVSKLREGMAEDLLKAESSEAIEDGVFVFPEEKWSRRVVGVFANRKAKQNPDRPHAILVGKDSGNSYVVSIRSAANSDKSAAEFCKKFPTGGGRVKAAGINSLPKEELERFLDEFRSFFKV